MKGIKKLLTGILAATMIMGASLNVCAADITINRDSSYTGTDAKGEQTYTYYKILSADINSQGTVGLDGKVSGGSASYYVDSQAKADALTGTNLFTATKAGDKWIITLKEGTNPTGDDIAKAIDTILTTTKTFGAGTEVKSTGDATKIAGLDAGYYVIKSSIGSTLIAQTLGENVVINEKNTYPSVDKKEKDADAKDFAKTADAMVGEVIDYTLSVEVPATASKEVRVIDTMSAGLTFVEGSIKVEGFTENTDWSRVETPEVEGATFQVNIKATEATKGKTVVISCQAKVNENAVVDTDKKNDVEIKYDNYSQKDTVPYNTYKTGIHKFDGADKKALAGVEFTIYVGSVGDKTNPLKVTLKDGYYVPSADATSNTVVTDKDGNIVVRGLDDDKTYWVYEEKTLPGYNMPTTDDQRSKQLVLVNDAQDLTDTAIAQIENNTGSILPSTGGIGTTIFYIIGGLLIVAAVAFFVVRRKADAE